MEAHFTYSPLPSDLFTSQRSPPPEGLAGEAQVSHPDLAGYIVGMGASAGGLEAFTFYLGDLLRRFAERVRHGHSICGIVIHTILVLSPTSLSDALNHIAQHLISIQAVRDSADRHAVLSRMYCRL